MNQYIVNVNDKSYNISVESQFQQTSNDTNYSENLSYESTKAEYDHCVQRSERLDNKVYIILTVYAFIFVLLCDILKKIGDFSFPKDQIQLALIIVYSILLTFNSMLYIFTLIQLTSLLKGVSIQRFSPEKVLERDMVNVNSITVARYVCSRYTQCIDTNNNILEKRFKKFNLCVNCIIPIIIISVLLVFISNFIS